MAGFALSGVTLVSLGLVLISTWAFPDVGCSGDACWMTWNRVALPSIVIGAFLAAVLGAQVGYWIGKLFGTALFKPDARIFKTKYLEQAHAFFEERGNRAVVIARFIPFVRTIVPILAGAGRMTQRAFFTANVIGAALWAVGISLLGFFVGNRIGADKIDKYLLPIVAVIIVVSLIPPFLEWRKHKRANATRG